MEIIINDPESKELKELAQEELEEIKFVDPNIMIQSLITTDLRNTGYYHVDFESANCSKLNNAQIDLIGITHGDIRNQRAGKHKQADALHLYYSISAKDQKRVKYELKKYQDSNDFYLIN